MGSRISEYIRAREEEMFSLLRKLVLIQSGTYNKKGVDRMAEEMRTALSRIPMEAGILKMEECGNMVLARTGKTSSRGQALLLGHMDTVFPEESKFNFYREDETKSYGPGVFDMKGGLVAMVFALKALSSEGLLEEIPVSVFCNSDEEIGSPYSGKMIEEEAERSSAVFVLEGGGTGSELVLSRKGKLGVELRITGIPGHAGSAGKNKSSAVLEAAHKTIQLESLNAPPDILVNVGLLRGGTGANTIAEEALLEVDIRFTMGRDEARLLKFVEGASGNIAVPGTRTEVKLKSRRPPMPSSAEGEKLYAAAENAAAREHIKIGREARGGVSDANLAAAKGAPVLDGLGPCGALDHSDREYIIKKSLPERACLLANCIMDVFQPGREEPSETA